MSVPSIGARLRDERTGHLGAAKWSGNQRWIAVEEATPLAYTFVTTPIDEVDGDEDPNGLVPHTGRRTLLRVAATPAAPLHSYVYEADGVVATTAAGVWRLTLPWGVFGALLTWEPSNTAALEQTVACHITSAYQAGRLQAPGAHVTLTALPDTSETLRGASMQDERYTIVVCGSAHTQTTLRPDGITISIADPTQPGRIAIAFHLDPAQAFSEAERLLRDGDMLRAHSAAHWAAYLQSCPVANLHRRPFQSSISPSLPSGELLLTRQLWHWWAALANVIDVPWSAWSPYLAPDRALWYGCWSNDTPEALCALALTNQRALARSCILSYLRAAFTATGDHAWLTHGYGRACLGHAGDSGVWSHGVPNIAHTVEFYIRHTDDDTLLGETTHADVTVWELLQRYMERIFTARDVNADGLIEWAHLWETGWDDKVSPFFAAAPIEEWMTAMTQADETLRAQWYAAHSRPITPIGENAFLLTALTSMARLAERTGKVELAAHYAARAQSIQRLIEERHWNPTTHWYHDWDVQAQERVSAQNLDGIYVLHHLSDPDRAAHVVAQLRNPARFGLRYPPTLSAEHPRFNPNGYWTGSYWPREMLYVGLALNRHDYCDLAFHLLVDALCSQRGSVIAEHLNPYTGQRLSDSQTMAYSACLNIALLEITTGASWW